MNNVPYFFMTSYVMYLLAARPTYYLGLIKKGSMHDENAWPYIVYPQLVKNKFPFKSDKYRLVNDGFIFDII